MIGVLLSLVMAFIVFGLTMMFLTFLCTIFFYHWRYILITTAVICIILGFFDLNFIVSYNYWMFFDMSIDFVTDFAGFNDPYKKGGPVGFIVALGLYVILGALALIVDVFCTILMWYKSFIQFLV